VAQIALPVLTLTAAQKLLFADSEASVQAMNIATWHGIVEIRFE
jgi:hypothetical protein